VTPDERTRIKDRIDAINERLDDIRVEYDKANDDEEYASENDLDCSPFVNYKYDLGQERAQLQRERDDLRGKLQSTGMKDDRTKIKDRIDAINERLKDIRAEYEKANDDEEYASANGLDCGPFVSYKYDLGRECTQLQGERDELRTSLQS